jgi:hypothetical protein
MKTCQKFYNFTLLTWINNSFSKDMSGKVWSICKSYPGSFILAAVIACIQKKSALQKIRQMAAVASEPSWPTRGTAHFSGRADPSGSACWKRPGWDNPGLLVLLLLASSACIVIFEFSLCDRFRVGNNRMIVFSREKGLSKVVYVEFWVVQVT